MSNREIFVRFFAVLWFTLMVAVGSKLMVYGLENYLTVFGPLLPVILLGWVYLIGEGLIYLRKFIHD